MTRRYWLMKSEPDVFSFDDLMARPKRTEPWEGVRNYQARNHLRDMKPGDRALFFHSSTNPPHVAGVVEIASAPRPDETALDPRSEYFDPKATKEDPRWVLVDVRGLRKLERPVPLSELRETPALRSMVVVQNTRLSVQPVKAAEYRKVLSLGGIEDP